VLNSSAKYLTLVKNIKRYGRVAVAFSGGVDSTLVLYAALRAVGEANVHVFCGSSELVTRIERCAAKEMLRELQVPEKCISEIVLHPLDWPEFVQNDHERCYFCKKRMYHKFITEGKKLNFRTLLDGSNSDDAKGHRPGTQAIQELGVKTPLLDAGLSKKEIRFLARKYKFSNHAKVSNSCLATRITEGEPITSKQLGRIEKCELFLIGKELFGFRVNPEGNDVVLRCSAENSRKVMYSTIHADIIRFLRANGFERVLLDMDFRKNYLTEVS